MPTLETRSGLEFQVKDLKLADFGRKEIRLAEEEMPGLMAMRAEYGLSLIHISEPTRPY